VETEPPRLSEAVVAARGQPSDALAYSAALRDTTPEGLRRELKGDLDTIVARALKKNPEERYASVTALADDLRRYLDDEPISARPDTLAYRAVKFVRRRSRPLAAVGAAALLLAGVVAFSAVRLAAERDRARLQAQKASKVSDLLTSLFSGADPFAERPGDATVRGLLDAGAARIDKELDGEPELQAEMLTVIGRIYHRLDLDNKARPLLEKAVASGRRAFGPRHERVAGSLNELGVLLRDNGDLAAGESVLKEALAMRRTVLGSEHPDVAVTLVELSRVYTDQGKDDRAEPLLRESLAIREKALGKDDHETGVSLGDLAHVLRRRGDLDGAESLFRQTLFIFRKTRGEVHPHVATILNNLGLIAADREDYPAAESLFRQSLAISRKTVGERHPSIASTLINLGRPLLEQGKYDEAASVLDEGIRMARASLGDDHALMAFGKIYMARVDLGRRDAAAAEPLLRDALRIRLRILPPDDWRVGVPKSILGQALTELGRFDEARALLMDAQRVLRNIPGAQGLEAKANRARLAELQDASARSKGP
jgi:tetratricopeptide (TPR) repeat protein